MFIAYLERLWGSYIIGCGFDVVSLNADDKQGAVEELKAIITGRWVEEVNDFDGGYWEDQRIKKAILYEVARSHLLPVERWYAEAVTKANQAIGESEKADELTEHERLKKLYGGQNDQDVA